MIPPWVRPESPETLRIIDDATVAFSPAFGRGETQRGIFADPRWGLHRRYRGLRSEERAAIFNALLETRGQLNILRVTPHSPIRGSFATSELLTNNTFANGTTGWTPTGSGAGTLSVSDRVLCIPHSANGAAGAVSTTVTAVQYAPYVCRTFMRQGRYQSGSPTLTSYFDDTGSIISSVNAAADGMVTGALVPATTSLRAVPQDAAGTTVAGDYFSLVYVSIARCALVDGGGNALLQSDVFDNASWTKTRATITPNSRTAPDGTVTGDDIVEDSTATNTHEVGQSITESSSAVDICFTVALRPGTRTWAQIYMTEATGSTSVSAYFNLSTGAVGTTATGANWSSLRTFAADLGNGWFQYAIVARKTNAATTVSANIRLATGDSGAVYSGNGASLISAWRATLHNSSVPQRLIQTTSATASTVSPTGSAMYTKGWPASTNGLLLAGDWFEWQGELKQLTAPVNSDGNGLAYMRFRPGLAGSPADNDPIIVFEPFGRFIYPQGVRELSNQFGVYSDCEMDLEEIYS